MSWRNDLPDRNRFGLVVPPEPITSLKKINNPHNINRSFISRHHLYWPKKVFVAAGSLACEFRSHQFNVVSLPRFQHDNYHSRYDEAVVHRYPGEIIPDDEVMAAFLDEANMLESLGVSLRAIDSIDEAIYEDRVKNYTQVYENKQYHFEKVSDYLKSLIKLELIRPEHSNAYLKDANELLIAS